MQGLVSVDIGCYKSSFILYSLDIHYIQSLETTSRFPLNIYLFRNMEGCQEIIAAWELEIYARGG